MHLQVEHTHTLGFFAHEEDCDNEESKDEEVIDTEIPGVEKDEGERLLAALTINNQSEMRELLSVLGKSIQQAPRKFAF